ncbi:MAG: HisA/HisF-related TIM barrel protein, partial [Holophagales bacterium]|nr:HisA/HisF-related TIM barrel protein [Holophagales bacterium]
WALDAGCDRLVLGSIVARDTDAFRALVERFPGRLVPALEVKGEAVKIAGWRESAPLGLAELCARLRGLDCPAALVTDVARDGTLQGPNLELALRVARAIGIPAILSGGVHALSDLEQAARAGAELDGVIVGKALYDGRIRLEEALAVFTAVSAGVATGPAPSAKEEA